MKKLHPEYILGAFKKLNMSSEIVHKRKVRGQHLYVFRKGNEKLAYTSTRNIDSQDMLKDFYFMVIERRYHFSDCML